MAKIENIHKIDWCEGGLKWADIENNTVGKNDLHPRMKYITVKLDSRETRLIQEG